MDEYQVKSLKDTIAAKQTHNSITKLPKFNTKKIFGTTLLNTMGEKQAEDAVKKYYETGYMLLGDLGVKLFDEILKEDRNPGDIIRFNAGESMLAMSLTNALNAYEQKNASDNNNTKIIEEDLKKLIKGQIAKHIKANKLATLQELANRIETFTGENISDKEIFDNQLFLAQIKNVANELLKLDDKGRPKSRSTRDLILKQERLECYFFVDIIASWENEHKDTMPEAQAMLLAKALGLSEKQISPDGIDANNNSLYEVPDRPSDPRYKEVETIIDNLENYYKSNTEKYEVSNEKTMLEKVINIAERLFQDSNTMATKVVKVGGNHEFAFMQEVIGIYQKENGPLSEEQLNLINKATGVEERSKIKPGHININNISPHNPQKERGA